MCSNGGKLSENFHNYGVVQKEECMSSASGSPAEVVALAILKYADIPGGLMPLLIDVHASLDYVPRESVAAIAAGMGLSRAEVHGVVSFYHDFHYEPRGQTTIHLCRAEACQAMGSRKLEQHVKSRLGIDFGGTTADGRFSLEPVYCLGNCACSPSIRIGDDVHARVDAARFDKLVAGS
jgi:formate dehydrogenase subunit gamma